MRIKEDTRQLRKQDDGYVWVQHYEVDMTQEDVEKNAENLLADLETATKDRDEIDLEKLEADVTKKVDQEKEVLELALKDYDKYLTDKIRDLKKDREKKKQKIRNQLNKWDKYREQKIQTAIEQTKNLLQNIENVIESKQKDFDHYKPFLKQDDHEDQENNQEKNSK